MRSLALVALAAHAAAADVPPADAARATKLFEQGHKLVESGQVDAACDAFAESLRLDPEIGTRLNLADCRERQGRLVEAHALFEQAAADATKANKEGRATFAREHVALLDKKLAHVTVRAPAGAAVTLQNAPVGAGPQLVMPGAITVDATAPDRAPFHVQRTVAAGEQVTIDVALEPVAITGAPPPSTGERPRPPHGRRPLELTIAGGGLVLASIVVGFNARSNWNDAIDDSDRSGVASAQHEADVATGVFVVGALTAAVGIYLYTTTPHGHVVVTPTADRQSAGVLVGGSF